MVQDNHYPQREFLDVVQRYKSECDAVIEVKIIMSTVYESATIISELAHGVGKYRRGLILIDISIYELLERS